MLVLVTYDVNTSTSEGRRRLRQVAKTCVIHGQRVQNSVFECSLDEAQFQLFRHQLLSLIDSQSDSLRFYMLGNKPHHRVEHVGAKNSYMPDDVLLL
ncbi:MAG: CRISPR-associated endonuclease Cas2 [Clostridiales bacterium]|nr:CRISPR-associated endonuclease Cas2 [Clostridiales bacterium]